MEAASVTIVTLPPIKESGSRKRKREVEEGSPSAEAVSEPNLKQTAPMILARWRLQLTKTTRPLRCWRKQKSRWRLHLVHGQRKTLSLRG